MLGILSLAPTTGPAHLSLEPLEDRFCPANPGITLSIAYAANQQVTLSGTVTDSAPANLPVQFTGVVTGNTTTNASGNFNVTLPATALGNVTATVTDLDNQSANAVQAVQDTAPVITSFSYSSEGGGYYDFYGQISYQAPQLLQVTFGGNVQSLTGQTTPVAADGSFDEAVHLNGTPNDNGTAIAQVLSDWWGLQSNEMYASVTQNPQLGYGNP
jgi:hypothetical protein